MRPESGVDNAIAHDGTVLRHASSGILEAPLFPVTSTKSRGQERTGPQQEADTHVPVIVATETPLPNVIVFEETKQ